MWQIYWSWCFNSLALLWPLFVLPHLMWCLRFLWSRSKNYTILKKGVLRTPWYLDSHGTTRPDKHILKLLLIINDWLIVLGFTPYPIRQYFSHITAVLIIRVKRRVVIPRALLDEEVRKMKNEMYMSKKAERVHV